MFLQAPVILSTRGRESRYLRVKYTLGVSIRRVEGGVGMKGRGRLEVYLVRHLLMVALVTKLPH